MHGVLISAPACGPRQRRRRIARQPAPLPGWVTLFGLLLCIVQTTYPDSATLTDANGKVTTWGLDTEGRITSKTYADASAINYVYESNTSRLYTMTDARGSVSTYAYNLDNTLSGVTYSPGTGVASTPNVSFAYDTVYNRVTGMTDGTGTTSYSYNAITGYTTTGAGRLASVSVPIASTTANGSTKLT